jgi:hypothetical protein
MALGLGMGSKYTALVPGVLVAAGALLLLRHRRQWLWLLPGLALFAGPWFIRNLATTGNPFFPQAVGPVTGGNTPISVLSTTIGHQILHGNGPVVRAWVKQVGRLAGLAPVLLVAGIVVAVVSRRGNRIARTVVALIAVGATMGYLATPYDGGGPDGLIYIIASSLRYSAFALLAGAALAAGVLGVRVAVALICGVFAWDLWRIHAVHGLVRADLDIKTKAIAVALLVGAAVATALVLTQARRNRPDGPDRPATGATDWASLASSATSGAALALVGVVVSVGVGFGVIHHIDAGASETPLEQALLHYGPHTPAVVLGELDLRAVLGPRLERPLIRVGRGGKAHEDPFVDADLVKGLLVDGQDGTAPAPASYSAALDAALAATHAPLLVIGSFVTLSYPSGWTPPPPWCLDTTTSEGSLYVTASLLGGHCPRS